LDNGIRFAPLRAGIVLDNYFSNVAFPLGMASNRDVSITSTQAIVMNTAVGAGRGIRTLDPALDLRAACTYYPLGTVVLADGQTTTHGPAYHCDGATRNGPVVMFRVTTAGTTSSGSRPAAFATATLSNLANTINDGEVTWTVESIPKDYVNDTAYIVGQRVFLPDDPGHYFECVEAGTSRAFTSFGVGLGATAPVGMVDTFYGGLFYDDSVTYSGHAPGLKWETIHRLCS
jgi:hypothetical protein